MEVKRQEIFRDPNVSTERRQGIAGFISALLTRTFLEQEAQGAHKGTPRYQLRATLKQTLSERANYDLCFIDIKYWPTKSLS